MYPVIKRGTAVEDIEFWLDPERKGWTEDDHRFMNDMIARGEDFPCFILNLNKENDLSRSDQDSDRKANRAEDKDGRSADSSANCKESQSHSDNVATVTSCVIACHGDRRDRCDRCDTCDRFSDSSTDRTGNIIDTFVRKHKRRPESSKVTERMTTCHRRTCRG